MNDAIISADGKFRYLLSRDLWEGRIAWVIPHSVLFIGLNPSTADAQRNDPTITREMAFARRWTMSTLYKVNLFAYRSTDPNKMMEAPQWDVVGLANDAHIREYAQRVDRIIAAWGAHGNYLNRDKEVMKMLVDLGALSKVFCLGLTKDGFPKHTLARGKAFIPYSFKPIPFRMEL